MSLLVHFPDTKKRELPNLKFNSQTVLNSNVCSQANGAGRGASGHSRTPRGGCTSLCSWAARVSTQVNTTSQWPVDSIFKIRIFVLELFCGSLSLKDVSWGFFLQMKWFTFSFFLIKDKLPVLILFFVPENTHLLHFWSNTVYFILICRYTSNYSIQWFIF